MLLGDFNAKAGSNFNEWGRTLGRHGVGEENDNGYRLLEMCSSNNLCLTNTQFIQKPCRKFTWTSPDGRTENLIDYIITREEWLTSVRKTRVYRSADIGSDHHLVVSEIKVKLHGKKPAGAVRYNTEKLKQQEIYNKFQIKMQNKFEALNNLVDECQEPETEWNNFKEAINQTAIEELGYRKTEKKTWVSIQTENIIAEVTRSKKEMLSAGSNNKKSEKNKNLNELRKQLKKSLSEDRNKMLENLAQEMEEAYKRGDSKKLFANVKKLSGDNNSKQISIEPVKKNGELITEKNKIMERWKEHFQEILNREEPKKTQETIQEIKCSEAMYEEEDSLMAEDISLEEVEKAVKQMRRNKAPGICKITAEMLQNTGTCTTTWLHRVITTVWKMEKVPADWRKAIIIPIHKKGDRQECGNSRGISLLSVPGKVFARVILNRIAERVDGVLRENQCGFRKGRGCSDQIFLIRQIIEKKIEYNEETVMCFIDFAQAYDSVWRTGAWHIMEKYGIHAKLVRLIKNLYDTTMACVRLEGEETEWFEIETGFKQGCILSPISFNMVLDYIMKRLEKLHNLGENSKPENTEDAEYADDACIIAECLMRIMEVMAALVEESEKFGLKMNYSKTKIMPIGKNETSWPTVKLAGHDVEVVRSFTYLGSEMKAEGGSESEIIRRIALAGSVFNKLQKMFKRHDIKLKIKLRVFNTCVIPVLIYGCESWSVTKVMENKLNAAENKWLRRILRISYREHVTNEDVRGRTQQPLISDTIRRRRMKWAGHVLRMKENRNPKRILNYKPKGKRTVGRPRRRWRDCFEEDLRSAGISLYGITRGRKRMSLEELAGDRRLWRDIMGKSMAGHGPGMKT
jgi:hypothetical protein